MIIQIYNNILYLKNISYSNYFLLGGKFFILKNRFKILLNKFDSYVLCIIILLIWIFKKIILNISKNYTINY